MRDIAGWVSYEHDLTNRDEEINAMTMAMTKDDCDSCSSLVRKHIGFGYRVPSESVRDEIRPSAIQSPRGVIAMVYTGNVINMTALRNKLVIRGYKIGGSSDADVLSWAYFEWGEDFGEQLNGSFAIAIWDESKSKLLMLRDRSGNQPIYFCKAGNGVFFGSEIKAIFASAPIDKRVNIDGLRELFVPTVHVPGMSLWKGISEVEPGNIVVVDEHRTRTRAYWKLPARPHADDRRTTIETIRELLVEVVRDNLNSKAQTGTLLSGGLDSSLVTSVSAELLAEQGRRLRTCSVDFSDNEKYFKKTALVISRDTPYVHEMARFVGSNHSDVVLTPYELADPQARRALIWSGDSPIGGEINISLYLLLAAVQEYIAIGLSGNGADGLFGGMPSLYDDKAAEKVVNPRVLADSAAEHVNSGWLRPEVVRQLDVSNYAADQHITAIERIEHLEGESETERQMRMRFNICMSLMSRILGKRDNYASRAAQVELRAPYSDHRIVEYVYNVPSSLKFFDGREKSLLRQAGKSVLPPSITHRVKSGYPTSQDPNYLQELQKQGKRIAAERNHSVFEVVNRSWLDGIVDADYSEISNEECNRLDQVLGIYHWIDLYSPQVRL